MAATVLAIVVAATVGVTVPLATSHAAAASGWNVVSAPNTGDGGYDIVLGTACPDAQDCWSVGFDLLNKNRLVVNPLVEQWDGQSWSVVSTPAVPTEGAALTAVTCVTSSDCWSVGATNPIDMGNVTPLAEQWDGSTWTVVAAPIPTGAGGGYLRSVSCLSSSDCWAAGYTTDAAGDPLDPLIEQWDGTAWSVVTAAPTGQPFTQLNAVTCASPSDCWAAGTTGPQQPTDSVFFIFPTVPGDQSVIEHWDGRSWALVPSYVATSPSGGYVAALTCVSADDCWASGSTTDDNGLPSSSLMQHWDGSSWSVVSTPPMPGVQGILSSLTCLSSQQCWAVGSTGTPGGEQSYNPVPVVEAWNGSAWSIEPSPNAVGLGLLSSVACVRGDACWSVGSAVVSLGADQASFNPLVEQMLLPPDGAQGFVAASSDGGVYNFGAFPFLGSMGGTHLARPVVGIAATPDDGGYWEVAADGGIFSFGDADYFGSMGGHALNAPVVGMARTPDGQGYWEVAADGGIFSFGDADFFGSMGGTRLDKPIVGMVAAPDGRGYWEVASDGGIFAFGSAAFYGSMGGASLGRPIVAMAATPNGRGYWEVGADGGIFAFGNATFDGSVPGQGIRATVPVVGMTVTPSGDGYWLIGADGSTYTYGDAIFLGSLAGIRLAAPVVGASS